MVTKGFSRALDFMYLFSSGITWCGMKPPQLSCTSGVYTGVLPILKEYVMVCQVSYRLSPPLTI